jgi:hypothetical protein
MISVACAAHPPAPRIDMHALPHARGHPFSHFEEKA